MKTHLKNRQLRTIIFLLLLPVLGGMNCRSKEQNKTMDLAPIKNLILFDRDAVVQYDRSTHLEEILNQQHSLTIPELNVQINLFAWGGEMGGPWKRVLCFFRPSPIPFQCEFLYKGEYEMSRMVGAQTIIKSGEHHSLGTQLTQVANALGDEIRLDKEKMKVLLTSVMVNFLGCEAIKKPYPIHEKELDFYLKTTSNLAPDLQEKFKQALMDIAHEINNNANPDVLFFEGELRNGFWKGTIRQYDDNGRFCIELEYLNGEFAYTIWM